MSLTLEPALALRRAIRPALLTLRSFGLQPQDRLIASFPRSGSTWLRFLLVHVLTGSDPEWTTVNEAIPYVGRQRRAPRLLPEGGRLLQTHDLEAGSCRRAIYLSRDVRDVVMATYRWHVRGGYEGDLESFVDAFVAGRAELFGAWEEHVRHWVGGSMARRGDLLVLRYEDMRAETAPVVRRVFDFLEVEATDAAIDAAIADNSLERMRAKEDRNPTASRAVTNEKFVGQGVVGGWRSRLTAEQLERIERSSREALLALGYPASPASDA